MEQLKQKLNNLYKEDIAENELCLAGQSLVNFFILMKDVYYSKIVTTQQVN